MSINMPHCMFENSDAAVQECYEWMDFCSESRIMLSESEAKAAKRMIKRMANFVADYEDIASMENTADTPKFSNVSCSQCGKDFGPGNSGFSHCENHK